MICLPVFSERTEAISYWWTEGGFGGVIGEGFSCPRPLEWGRKRPLSLCYSISPYLGKTMDTAWNGMTPIGVVPVGASRLWGWKGLINRA